MTNRSEVPAHQLALQAAEQSNSTDRKPAEVLIWAVCLFLLTNPFPFLLSGINPSVGIVRDLGTMRGASEGSSVPMYALRALVLLVVTVFTLRDFRATRHLWRMSPMIAFVSWAAISLLWTDSFTTSVNAMLALLLLLSSVALIAARMPLHQFARAVVYSGAVMAAASFVWLVAFPNQAIHTASDAAQSVHAGAWRGVYIHKNLLGQTAAIYATAILVSNKDIISLTWVKYLLLAAMLLIIAGTSSASALAIPVLGIIILFYVIVISNRVRTYILVFLPCLLILLLMGIAFILDLLGRDMTFTGRTTIWEVAGRAISLSAIKGYGYMSSTYGNFTEEIYKIMGVTDPHNALVDTILGLGIVGAALLVFGIVRSFITARQLYLAGGSQRSGALVLAALQVAWLIAGLTESNVRPFVPMAVLGFISMGILVFDKGRATTRSGAQSLWIRNFRTPVEVHRGRYTRDVPFTRERTLRISTTSFDRSAKSGETERR